MSNCTEKPFALPEACHSVRRPLCAKDDAYHSALPFIAFEAPSIPGKETESQAHTGSAANPPGGPTPGPWHKPPWNFHLAQCTRFPEGKGMA